MKAVIYVAPEVIGTMKPRTGTNKDSTVKPLRAVVAVRGATIRSGVIVTIGTIGCSPDLDSDLGIYFGSGDRKAHCANRSKGKRCEYLHEFSSVFVHVRSYIIRKVEWALACIAQFGQSVWVGWSGSRAAGPQTGQPPKFISRVPSPRGAYRMPACPGRRIDCLPVLPAASAYARRDHRR